MAPKKAKDIADENYWRKSIEDAKLDEENWKVKVIILEAGDSDEARNYLNKFEIFATEEKRFVVKSISRTETIFMVNQLGGEKKNKEDDSCRVFEEGQLYLKEKKDIPPDVQALIIKHLILKLKEDYLLIKRRRLEVKEGMRRESVTMVDRSEIKGLVSVKPPELPLSPPTAKKGKKDDVDTSLLLPELADDKKYNTQLRVRGEEWRDKVYVDDFPTDGPNLYIAITGFVEPLLLGRLIAIGVPITAIIQIKISSKPSVEVSGLFKAAKRGQSQTEILKEKSFKFWDDLQNLRIQKDTADDFTDTAFVVFTPPYWDTEKLSGSPDKIYDEVCYLLYDVQDLTRQHDHYLGNMEVVNIPAYTTYERYNKQYNQLMNDYPLECITLYTLLDNILQIVCKHEELDSKSSRSSLSTAMTILQSPKRNDNNKVEQAENLVKDVFMSLIKSEDTKKTYRVTQGYELEHEKDATIINYGDIAQYSTFHLGNINLDNIIRSTLLGMPINRLWQNVEIPNYEIEAKINFHKNVLLSCFERNDVETSELYRLIHILAFRKLYNNRSSLKKRNQLTKNIYDFKKKYLKRSTLAEPLSNTPSLKNYSSSAHSFPSIHKSDIASEVSLTGETESNSINCIFDCPDISELVSEAEIVNETPVSHLIDEFEYFEDFSGICAFQIILEAFNTYNCVDYKYCEVTDSFVLMFFNSYDKDGVACDEWRGHIPTPLCLQDFFDYTLEENYDWIQKEEKAYDEHVIFKVQSQFTVLNHYDPDSCLENVIGTELLMEGSLKHQDIQQNEEASPETTEVKSASKKTTTSPTTDSDSKNTKKTKTSTPPKKVRRSFILPENDSEMVIIKKPFLGYDLGNRRVEVFGRDAAFFSKDGTKVKCTYTLFLPTNLEYLTLSVMPGSTEIGFWFHRALCEIVSNDINDVCNSLRISTTDELMIHLKSQSHSLGISPTLFGYNEEPYCQEDDLKPNFVKGSSTPVETTLAYFSLYVTWPNGLITESVHEKDLLQISHIKQYYVSSFNIDEKFRCVSKRGEVIIFKKSGQIQILKPNGSIVQIINCFKTNNNIISEDSPSENSSEKSKKPKGKEGKDKVSKDGKDGKDKSNKTSAKSSKNMILQDENVINLQENQPELIIEEYDTIDTDGLHQKNIKGNSHKIKKLLIRTATDFCLGEIFSTRTDGTNMLLNKDGVQVVTYPDGTRIITKYIVETEEIYPEWSDEEILYYGLFNSNNIDTDSTKSKLSMSQKSGRSSYLGSTRTIDDEHISQNLITEEIETDIERNDGYVSIKNIYTIEHINFTTVVVNTVNETMTVESPNKTKITIDKENNFEFNLDSVTTAYFDGVTFHINYTACEECQSRTNCEIKMKVDESSSLAKSQQVWCKTRDSFGKTVIVNEEGAISTIEDPDAVYLDIPKSNVNIVDGYNTPGLKSEKSESPFKSHENCRDLYIAKTLRFFVLKRNLSCAELVHRDLLDQYKQECRWQPWCSINKYDVFGDNRSLISIISPIHLTESEKWLMDSILADKPKYLTYKDLKKDTGKGVYHWMRPYDRFTPRPAKPDNVLPARLPRAYIIRILEQQWPETKRGSLKGATELLSAVLRYRRVMEADKQSILNTSVVDQRVEDERCIDDIVQAVGHRVYENLKQRLKEDVLSRAKATITTLQRPKSAPEDLSAEGEAAEVEESTDTANELLLLQEERKNLLHEVEKGESMSSNLKRYWRRRNEEYKEEQFYKYLLREDSVPPYFRNVLGGAIWWEMNNTAGEAVTEAERTRMNCGCAENTSHTDDKRYFM